MLDCGMHMGFNDEVRIVLMVISILKILFF